MTTNGFPSREHNRRLRWMAALAAVGAVALTLMGSWMVLGFWFGFYFILMTLTAMPLGAAVLGVVGGAIQRLSGDRSAFATTMFASAVATSLPVFAMWGIARGADLALTTIHHRALRDEFEFFAISAGITATIFVISSWWVLYVRPGRSFLRAVPLATVSAALFLALTRMPGSSFEAELSFAVAIAAVASAISILIAADPWIPERNTCKRPPP